MRSWLLTVKSPSLIVSTIMPVIEFICNMKLPWAETYGGRSLPKFEVGDGPCIRPPNIWRSSVTGCVCKYELSKKRCNQGIFFLKWRLFSSRKEFFSSAKDHIYQISDSKNRPSEIFGVKKRMFFLETGHYEIFFRETFFRPPKLGAKSPPIEVAE